MLGGGLWCPSVCQPLREGGNEGGWDTCLYPECLFNTSRVMKGSWARSRLFGFPPMLLGLTVRWQDFATERVVRLSHWSRGESWGKIGHRGANNSKIMQMVTNIPHEKRGGVVLSSIILQCDVHSSTLFDLCFPIFWHIFCWTAWTIPGSYGEITKRCEILSFGLPGWLKEKCK